MRQSAKENVVKQDLSLNMLVLPALAIAPSIAKVLRRNTLNRRNNGQ